MPRQKAEPDTSTYTGRVSARLRMLREKKFPDIERFRDALTVAAGHEYATSTIYAWERGIRTVPQDAFPAIAKALGFKNAHSWLPDA